jgi:hypothetical protein
MPMNPAARNPPTGPRPEALAWVAVCPQRPCLRRVFVPTSVLVSDDRAVSGRPRRCAGGLVHRPHRNWIGLFQLNDPGARPTPPRPAPGRPRSAPRTTDLGGRSLGMFESLGRVSFRRRRWVTAAGRVRRWSATIGTWAATGRPASGAVAGWTAVTGSTRPIPWQGGTARWREPAAPPQPANPQSPLQCAQPVLGGGVIRRTAARGVAGGSWRVRPGRWGP